MSGGGGVSGGGDGGAGGRGDGDGDGDGDGAPAPTSRHVTLATGLDTHVLSWGDGDHTVVLLHGFLDLAWEWAEVAAVRTAR